MKIFNDKIRKVKEKIQATHTTKKKKKKKKKILVIKGNKK